ncbi:thioredoxin [Deinococcus aquatilis]|uniref:thioredoxin n=1 Tax=Deinococcus aquatilis TaxID=519440 RepID=UPI00035DC0ED|nr:thioredoxin [Deinococcus aquatilis]
MNNTQELNDANFAAGIAEGYTLVDFWAPWCAPCRFIAPIVQELAEEYQGRISVAKLNVDESTATAMRYHAMSLPTLILFKDGELVCTTIGAQPKRNFQAMLETELSRDALI